MHMPLLASSALAARCFNSSADSGRGNGRPCRRQAAQPRKTMAGHHGKPSCFAHTTVPDDSDLRDRGTGQQPPCPPPSSPAVPSPTSDFFLHLPPRGPTPSTMSTIESTFGVGRDARPLRPTCPQACSAAFPTCASASAPVAALAARSSSLDNSIAGGSPHPPPGSLFTDSAPPSCLDNFGKTRAASPSGPSVRHRFAPRAHPCGPVRPRPSPRPVLVATPDGATSALLTFITTFFGFVKMAFLFLRLNPANPLGALSAAPTSRVPSCSLATELCSLWLCCSSSAASSLCCRFSAELHDACEYAFECYIQTNHEHEPQYTKTNVKAHSSMAHPCYLKRTCWFQSHAAPADPAPCQRPSSAPAPLLTSQHAQPHVKS